MNVHCVAVLTVINTRCRMLCTDSEGFLTSLTKTLQKHVPVGATSRDTHDNLEHSMKRVCDDLFIYLCIYLKQNLQMHWL